MSKMGLEGTDTEHNSPSESRVGEKGNMSKMGLKGQVQTATHPLKSRQGRRQCEQERWCCGGTGTDINTHAESRVGKKVM